MRAIAVFLSVSWILFEPVHAQAVRDFYKQNTLSIVVAHEPGTGFDLYARVLARHLPKHVPGSPKTVVQNMPGAGGLTAYNWLANVAPRDGTVFATAASTVPFEPLLGNKAAQFKASDLQWIGSMDSSVNICAVAGHSGVTDFEDIFQREVLLGSSGRSSPLSILPRALRELTGAQFKVIEGYQGSAAVKLAMVRREVDGICGISLATAKSQFADMVSTGSFKIILQIGPEPHPEIPDVTHIYEYAKTAKDREVFEILFGGQALGRSFAAPPRIPPDRLDTLRSAFAAVLRDPDLIAEATKLDLDIRFRSGQTLQEYVDRVSSAPADAINRAKQAIGRE